MGKLRSITKNDSSTNGKYKIYLCVHGDEIGDYVDRISKMVLSQYTNCAIWYYDENEGSSEGSTTQAYEDDLSQMRLFIVPVTKKFLEAGNRALDRDLSYAKKHNIPMLFLLQDDDLVDEFNRVCGNLHLIKESDDQYKEKVDQFLSLLFTDEETKNKVKKSFDAKIFLSYRKLDRVHAKRLINLIHKNYKYVSIWFDDYLTSGENFDVQIMSELKSSNLVVLVVTPNVLTKGNYVRKREYPKAKITYKKIVIPIEMAATDKGKLSKAFHEIGKCVDSTDEEELVKILGKELGGYHGNTKLTQDVKDYLIGLGYLLGINVERDAALGYNMIKSAADAGNYEAMNRLYQMYRGGDYVKEDYKEAINWKFKSIRTLCALRYSARYGYQRKKYGVQYVHSCLELLNYIQLLTSDYYGFDQLDQDFIFLSKGLDVTDLGRENSTVNLYASNLSDMKGMLNLFAASLFDQYPCDETRLALVKVTLFDNEVYLSSKNDDPSTFVSIQNNYEAAMELLKEGSLDNDEIQLLIAKIYIGEATWILRRDRDIFYRAIYGGDQEFKQTRITEQAKSSVLALTEYADRAIEILEKLRKDSESYTIMSALEEAYSLKRSSLAYDLHFNASPYLKEEYKKYSYLLIGIERDIVAESETRKNVAKLRDSCFFLLYEVANDRMLKDLLTDQEHDALVEEIYDLESCLEAKWKVKRKYTCATED